MAASVPLMFSFVGASLKQIQNAARITYYPTLAEMMFNLVVEIYEKLGINIEITDFGGGIGIPYRPEQEPVDILSVGEAVRKVYERIISPTGLEVAIYTELGRFITGPHGYLVTSVRGFKHIYKEYIGVDAQRIRL